MQVQSWWMLCCESMRVMALGVLHSPEVPGYGQHLSFPGMCAFLCKPAHAAGSFVLPGAALAMLQPHVATAIVTNAT